MDINTVYLKQEEHSLCCDFNAFYADCSRLLDVPTDGLCVSIALSLTFVSSIV